MGVTGVPSISFSYVDEDAEGCGDEAPRDLESAVMRINALAGEDIHKRGGRIFW